MNRFLFLFHTCTGNSNDRQWGKELLWEGGGANLADITSSPPAQKISSSRPPCSEVDDTKSSPETSFKSIFCAVRTWNHENQTTARADEMEPRCITAIILPILLLTIIIITIIITLSPYLQELTTDLDGLGWLSRSYQILTALHHWLHGGNMLQKFKNAQQEYGSYLKTLRNMHW